jgi:AraC-like DNA-binding protein/FixJ family two-component response regulator
VLIADDEYWIRQSLLTLIDWRAHGFECLEPAVDGEDAWERIRRDAPDVAVLDIDMPFVSGTELTRRVRDESPGTAVLILSGYSDFEYVREALTYGAVDYLLKPADPDKLVAALNRAVEVLEAQRARRAEAHLMESAREDRVLSRMLDAAGAGRDPLEALDRPWPFSGYHLVAVLLGGKRQGAEDGDAIKERILTALEPAAQALVFRHTARPDTCYVLAGMKEQALVEACGRFAEELTRRLGARVTCLISHRLQSPDQLKCALDELKQLQITQPFRREGTVVSASAREEAAIVSRVSASQRRELELAARTRSRPMFQQALDGIGLARCREENWLRVEFLYTLNAVSFILVQGAMERGDARLALALDGLLEPMLMAADRLDADEALSILGEMTAEYFGSPEEAPASDSMRETVRQVRAYVEANYFQELSLTLLARRFLVDDSHLSRLFKQLTNENLTLYIARTRVEKAKALIRAGGLSLSEIAAAVGYDDYAYFNRVFRKVEGVSPSTYKEGNAQ